MSLPGAPAICSSHGHAPSSPTQVSELHKGRATWLVHIFSTLPCGPWATSSRSGWREKKPGCPALGDESPWLRLHFSASKKKITQELYSGPSWELNLQMWCAWVDQLWDPTWMWPPCATWLMGQNPGPPRTPVTPTSSSLSCCHG